MKAKICLGVLGGLLAASCAWSPYNDRIWVTERYSDEYVARTSERIGQQTLAVSAKTFDQVWDICERTLISLGFPFYKVDKTAGEFVVRPRRASADSTTPGQETAALKEASDADLPERMYVSISRSGREVAFQVGFVAQVMDRKIPSPKSDSEWDQNSLYIKSVNREVSRVIAHLKKPLGS
jgi:hypothetical protein